MPIIDITPIKTFIKDLGGNDYKTLHFEALSDGRFVVEIYDILMWPEGLSCEDDPVHEGMFNSYLAAHHHLSTLIGGYVEVENNENLYPIDIVHNYIKNEIDRECCDDYEDSNNESLEEGSDMDSLNYEIIMEGERDEW